MPLSKEDIENLESFFYGRLSKVEEKNFKEWLKQPVEFGDDARDHLDLLLHLDVMNKAKLRDELKSLEPKKEAPSAKTFKLTYSRWVIAASISIVAIFLITYLTRTGPNEILKRYYKPFPTNIAVRDNTRVDKAVEAYSNSDYALALSLFLQRDDVFLSGTDSLLIANCYIETNKEIVAVDMLVRIQSSKNKALVDHAKWYLALTYLKMNSIDQAQLTLKSIDAESLYTKESMEILKLLD